MADHGIGDYFISDVDDELVDEEDELISAPVVVPQPSAQAQPRQAAKETTPAPDQPVREVRPASAPAPAPTPSRPAAESRPQTTVRPPTREERLAGALDDLMLNSPDIQAAALVSMDGFTMASAMPEGMQEDRVGAMSAAILGLGERAAAELGRGHLTQVFIEGAEGYVVLIAAGPRAVLTTLAQSEAKLGLVLYDMKATAAAIGEILG